MDTSCQQVIALQQQQEVGAAAAATTRGAGVTSEQALAALALQQQQHQSAAEAGPFPRRLLRFVLGPLVRRGSIDSSSIDASSSETRAHASAQPQQRPQQPQQLPSDASLLGDSLCGCSDDGTEGGASEDVLGMSPFASCADLQDYRLLLQQRRRERETARQHAAAAAQLRREQQEQQQHAGPLRRVLQWVVHGLRSVSRHISPQGEGNNDSTLGERIFNVVTSVPFVLVGIHSLR